MNKLLAARFVERIHRLALGLEPFDAARAQRVTHPVAMRLEGPHRDRLPAIERHDSGLHALRYRPGLGTHAMVRLLDPARRFVPRRLRIPLPDFAAEPDPPLPQRNRRLALFPGAAYDVAETATGLRGRVQRGPAPQRWARVTATLPGTSLVVGRAHGDDRGEFLLLLASEALPVGELNGSIDVNVTVSAPAVPPVPPTPETPAQDPFWDLPLELVPAALLPDDVSPGTALPTDYTAETTVAVILVPGRIISSQVATFVIP